jgi:hypothetical protein
MRTASASSSRSQRPAFGSLRELHGDKAVWKLVKPRTDRVREGAISRPLPRDVDTWEDYEAACRRLWRRARRRARDALSARRPAGTP